jgi:glycosyltransferase involved in cell wall biosynthesis
MTQSVKNKVLYVITKSNYGGAQRYVFDLATHLPTAVYDVVVAYGGTGLRGAEMGALGTHLARAGIRTIQITHFMRDMHILEDVRAFFELLHIIRREKPDVLHVTSSKAGGLGALAGRLAGIPCIIFTSHGLTFDEKWRPYWQRIAITLFTWCTLMLAHKSIMISHDTYERASALPWAHNKIALIYNGISTPLFYTRDEATSALQHILPTKIQHPCIGTIAELHPNKNLSIVLDALSILKKEGLMPHFIIMGTGDEYEALNTYAHICGVTEQVHFAGYVHEAARHLLAYDIFILPSAKEGLPYVLLEAGHAALPVVASDIPGNRDIITSGESGTLVSAEARTLATALQQYIQEPTLRAVHGTALQKKVHTLFSIEHMVRQTCNLYTCSKPATSLSKSSRRTDRS